MLLAFLENDLFRERISVKDTNDGSELVGEAIVIIQKREVSIGPQSLFENPDSPVIVDNVADIINQESALVHRSQILVD